MKKYNLIIIVTVLLTFGCKIEKDNTLPTKLVDNSWAEGIYFFEYNLNINKVRVDPFIVPSIIRSDTLSLFMNTKSYRMYIVIDGFTGEGIYTNKTTYEYANIQTYQVPRCGYSNVVVDSFSQEGYISGTFDGGVAFEDMCDDPPYKLYTEGKFALLHE